MTSCPPINATPLLREAAELKFEEFSRVKQAFAQRYHLDGERPTDGSPLKRVTTLLEKIKKVDPYLELDDDLLVMARYVEQAKDDRSVSESKLLKYEDQLWNKLRRHLNRLEVSSLHMDLMREAMDPATSSPSLGSKLEKMTADDDFEVVESELEEVLEEFEKDTLTVKDIDVEAIEEYLASLFDTSDRKRALERLREDIKLYGNEMIERCGDLDQDFLMWCIMDLLKNDLISEEKRKILESYAQSPIIVRELVTTLNFKSVRHWNWKNFNQGLPVAARKNAEGQYCITVEEEILDMLFLHTTAISWAMKLKELLKNFARSNGLVGNQHLTLEELDKREFFLLGPRRPIVNLPQYYPPPAPPVPFHYDSPAPFNVPRRKQKKRLYPVPPPPVVIPQPSPPPPPPPSFFTSMNDERYRVYMRDFFMSRLPTKIGSTPSVPRPADTEANLIKSLAIDAKLRDAFDGKAHIASMRFDNLAPSLPHKTILAVLKFLGVPETFLEFFTRFLEAKLNFGPAVHGAPDRIVQRTRGTPAGHGMSLFFTETVLFFVELAVNSKTGSLLYRMGDRCHFVGTQSQRHGAVDAICRFVSVMGLKLDEKLATDELSIGFLTLKSHGAQPVSYASFDIMTSKVEAYAHHMKKRLATCRTVLEWIRTWNGYVGEYAANLFGPLVGVFGPAHIQAVKQAYNRMYDIIFEGSTLTNHVKNLLTSHLDCDLGNPAFALEAIIYLPQAYGGLGVKNPFIALNLAHNLKDDPDEVIRAYLKSEDAYYTCAAERYAAMKPHAREKMLNSVFNDDKDLIDAALGPDRDLSVFPTKDEITADRERAPYVHLPLKYPDCKRAPTPLLATVYENLSREFSDRIFASEKVSVEISHLSRNGNMKAWYRLSGEDRWVLQMYADECFERYDTLEIWHAESVPVEILKALRGHIFDDDDDDDDDASSYYSFID